MVKARSILIAVAVAIAAVGGYWAFASWQKQSQHAAISALVRDATGVLNDGLGKSPAGDEPKRIDAALERLRSTRASRQRPFAEAAEVYLVGARAVLDKRAEIARLRQHAEASRRQLEAHMATPRGRNDSWIRQATDLKKRMDQAYFDLNVALEAQAELLRTLPDSETRLVPEVGKGALVAEGLILTNLQRTQDDLKRVAAERASAGQLR